METRFTIVGIGEALFDIFPDAQRLGGAPLNVAVQAHQLGQVRGGRGVVVSRVGQDGLGEELLEQLRQRGMVTDYIQTDPDRPTGRVFIDVDEQGQHHFEIEPDAAWDVLQFDPDLEDLARTCDAVCFGSLAQRDAQSRNSIYRFLDAARRAVRLFDVNLRASFYEVGNIRRGCEMASIVKLNEEELPEVAQMLGLGGTTAEVPDEAVADERARALLKMFDLDLVVLTRGKRGTRLYTKTETVDGEPVTYPPAEGADAVGAGDACTAGILVGRVLRLPLQQVANLANHMGAYVASQPGATPPLAEAVMNQIKR